MEDLSLKDKKKLLNIQFKIEEVLKKNNYTETTIQFVISSYKEKHRYYHTLEHINDLLTSLDYEILHNQDVKKHYNKLQLAIIFHDLYYNVGDKNNELYSADLFNLFTEKDKVNSITFDEKVLIVDAIISTKDHLPRMYNILSEWLIKFDLAGFGLPFKENLKLEEKVQKEFSSHYTWEQYKKNKIKFLQIYRDRVFTKEAVDNIDLLIDYLSNLNDFMFDKKSI